MARLRKRGEVVRQFILEKIAENLKNIVQLTSNKFEITRQAVNKHINILVNQKVVSAEGNTRNRRYSLCTIKGKKKTYLLDKITQEDVVWRDDFLSLLTGLPENVIDIWHYQFY